MIKCNSNLKRKRIKAFNNKTKCLEELYEEYYKRASKANKQRWFDEIRLYVTWG